MLGDSEITSSLVSLHVGPEVRLSFAVSMHTDDGVPTVLDGSGVLAGQEFEVIHDGLQQLAVATADSGVQDLHDSGSFSKNILSFGDSDFTMPQDDS